MSIIGFLLQSRRRWAICSLPVVTAGLWAMTAAAPTVTLVAASPGQGPVAVLTFNMCGQHCNADSTGGDITALVNLIDQRQPAAVLLQEVCHAQFNELQSTSQEAPHWAMYGATDVTEPHGCDDGNDSFGDAVLVHQQFDTGTVETKALPYVYGHGRNRQTRKVLCLLSVEAFPRATEVCTVHAGLAFEIGAKHQATQIKKAYTFARGRDARNPLVFGGDFNVTPASNALDPVYVNGGGGAHGAMEEVDQCPNKHGREHHTPNCNAHTHDATPQVHHRTKNDYIFLSHKSFRDTTGSLESTSYSDHVPLLGTMTECASGVC